MATEFARDPRAASRAAERAKRNARAVIGFRGGIWRVIAARKNPRLNVVAVVGPGRVGNREVSEAVLFEVGVFRGRAYNRGHPNPARHRSRNTLTVSLRQRCRYTREQYEAFAPVIFRLLQKLADRRASQWKSFALGFSRRRNRDWYLRGRQRMVTRKKSYRLVRGVRFNAAVSDQCFVSDIYWAELESDPSHEVMRRMRGLGKWSGLVLARHCARWRGEDGAFLRLEVVRRIIGRFRELHLPAYLVRVALRHTRLDRRTRFFGLLEDALGVNGVPFPEEELAAQAYPNRRDRLGSLDVRVIGVRNKHLVFEVLPAPPPKPTPAVLPEDVRENRSEETAELFSALPF